MNKRAPLPAGTVTHVFTDIEGSSDLWEKHGDAFKSVLDAHNCLMRDNLSRWNGYEVKTIGDGFFIAFAKASDAVQFAVDAQLEHARYDWSSLLPDLAELFVRMGIHTGEPLIDQHPSGTPDYFGRTVNRAARVEGTGHGGQIIVSQATYELARGNLPPESEISFQDLGEHELKGIGTERLWQVRHPHLRPTYRFCRSLALPLIRLDTLRDLPTLLSEYPALAQDAYERFREHRMVIENPNPEPIYDLSLRLQFPEAILDPPRVMRKPPGVEVVSKSEMTPCPLILTGGGQFQVNCSTTRLPIYRIRVSSLPPKSRVRMLLVSMVHPLRDTTAEGDTATHKDISPGFSVEGSFEFEGRDDRFEQTFLVRLEYDPVSRTVSAVRTEGGTVERKD